MIEVGNNSNGRVAEVGRDGKIRWQVGNLKYPVDAVHFDDYFYPYPVAGQTFDALSARPLPLTRPWPSPGGAPG